MALTAAALTVDTLNHATSPEGRDGSARSMASRADETVTINAPASFFPFFPFLPAPSAATSPVTLTGRRHASMSSHRLASVRGEHRRYGPVYSRAIASLISTGTTPMSESPKTRACSVCSICAESAASTRSRHARSTAGVTPSVSADLASADSPVATVRLSTASTSCRSVSVSRTCSFWRR
eukprot:scaffold5751_cov112-Isochrysis_galbana.AAC.3